MTRLIAEAIAMVGVFVLIPFGLAEAVHHGGLNPFMANAYGTALSSASPIEPASPSRPYGLQSTFAGEPQ
jgi:hypothetical protein